MELFTIGQVAKLYNMNVRTLRYYDSIGLLSPECVNEETGYRYYSTRQFERLNTVIYLRQLDIPIESIMRFFEKRDVSGMRKMLEQQKELIRIRQEELKRIDNKLDRRLEQLAAAEHQPVGIVRRIYLPERKVLRRQTYQQFAQDFEYELPTIERQYGSQGTIMLGKVAFSISKEDILAHRYESFSQILIILEEGDKTSEEPDIIPGGDFLVLYYNGSHRDSGPFYEELMSYAEKNRFELIGDSVETTIVDYGLTNDPNRFLTKLQIPVRAL